MSVRPGVTITQRSTPPPRSAPTDTGVWHVVGLTDAGPTAPQLITSMADYERIYGARVSYSILYDALDVFFREGGGRAYISRVVGPAATIGTKNLSDGAAGTSLVVNAIGPGSYSSAISVGVRAGTNAGEFIIFVVVGGVEVETSPSLVDTAAAVAWSAASGYIRLVLGASALDPAVAAASALSAGSDDRASITDTHRQIALDRLSTDYGPGQVSMPGVVTATAHAMLLAHAATRRRRAILDDPDTGTSATLLALAIADRVGNQRFGGGFAPWIVVPGYVAGTFRTVPPSALIAGKIAANTLTLGAADPAAGDAGISNYAVGLSQPAWDDATRTALNNGGVNVIRQMFNTVRIYGWRSLVDPSADPEWKSLGAAGLFMAISARAAALAEAFMFDIIDGQGKKIAEFGGALAGMLLDFYNTGDLYGETPQEAFYVDVGNQVNTVATLQANELHAVLNVKMSPFGEYIQIDVVKRPISEGVS